MANIHSLPLELLREILNYLPIQSLFAFGLTSKSHHAIETICLSRLRLGVFPTRLSAMVSLMEAGDDLCGTHSVKMILPKRQAMTKNSVCRNQNVSLAKVASKYHRTLRELELALWELRQPLAESVAQIQHLRRLSIRLDHPHTRHTDVDRSFWNVTTGSTVWNSLFSKKTGEMVFGRLESLNLERAGITDYQLQRILEDNPRITDLRLQKCLLLTQEIFEYLSKSKAGKKLRILHFTNTTTNEIDDRILNCIGKLTSLEALSLHGCNNIDSDLVQKFNDEQWKIPKITFPHNSDSPKQIIEIDPEYK